MGRSLIEFNTTAVWVDSVRIVISFLLFRLGSRDLQVTGYIGNVGLADVKGTISPDGRPGFYLESDDPVADNFLGGCEQLVDGKTR